MCPLQSTCYIATIWLGINFVKYRNLQNTIWTRSNTTLTWRKHLMSGDGKLSQTWGPSSLEDRWQKVLWGRTKSDYDKKKGLIINVRVKPFYCGEIILLLTQHVEQKCFTICFCTIPSFDYSPTQLYYLRNKRDLYELKLFRYLLYMWFQCDYGNILINYAC